jgi:hypothetical protein
LSANKLQEVSKSLAGFSQKQVESWMHTQLVQSVTHSLWQVLDDFLEEVPEVAVEEHVADSASTSGSSDKEESFIKEEIEVEESEEEEEEEDEISDEQEVDQQANAVEDD